MSNGGKLWGWLLLQWLQTYHHLQVKFMVPINKWGSILDFGEVIFPCFQWTALPVFFIFIIEETDQNNLYNFHSFKKQLYKLFLKYLCLNMTASSVLDVNKKINFLIY